MRSTLQNYIGMILIALVAVVAIGAVALRIDREQEVAAPDGITATPAIHGNAPAGLVDVRWLQQYKSQVDHIFDLSDARQYEAGHIPGAHHIWWQDAIRLHSANYGEPDHISTASIDDDVFGKLDLGIPQNSRVVLYDANNSERASWLMWVMTLNGYTDVHVLDGGFSAWLGAGGELSTEAVGMPDTGAIATPIWSSDHDIRRESLLESLDDPDLRLIDTRSATEQQDDVNGTIRLGHIPGSINIPTAEVMREDGTFKSAEDLQELFADRGIDPDHQVVVYSLFSIHSGNLWLALQIAGYDDVVIYHEGFVAWGYDHDLPLDTSPYPTQEQPATPAAATPISTPEATAVDTPQSTPVPDFDGPTDLTGD